MFDLALMRPYNCCKSSCKVNIFNTLDVLIMTYFCVLKSGQSSSERFALKEYNLKTCLLLKTLLILLEVGRKLASLSEVDLLVFIKKDMKKSNKISHQRKISSHRNSIRYNASSLGFKKILQQT